MFEAPNRKVHTVFLHCSASDVETYGQDLRDLIYRWHVTENQWNDIGYHFLIDKRGEVLPGRPLESTPAAQKGHNSGTIAIMVHGLNDFSHDSLMALRALCQQINEAYSGLIRFRGHSEVSAKSCPVYEFRSLLKLDRFGRMP